MYVPTVFVFCRCHRGEFAVDGDQALERPLRFRAHHLCVHLREHATYMRSGKCWGLTVTRLAVYRVLPSEHSTWPSSAPNERVCGRAWRNSRPSRRRVWSRAAAKKSFSGSEGDGGRMVGDGGPGVALLLRSDVDLGEDGVLPGELLPLASPAHRRLLLPGPLRCPVPPHPIRPVHH